MPYQSSNNIAELLSRRGAIEGNRIVRSADAWATGIGQLGQVAGDTIQGLMKKTQYDEEQKRLEPARALEARKIGEESRNYEIQDAIRESVAKRTGPDGVVDRAGVATDLRDIGYDDGAEAYLQTQKDKANSTIADALNRIDHMKSVTGQGMQLAQELQDNPGAYQNMRGKLADYFTAAGVAVDVPADYDAEKVGNLIQTAGAHRAQIDAQEQSMKDVLTARANGVTGLNLMKKEQQALADHLVFAQTEDAWNKALDTARELHVSEEAIGSFGKWNETAPEHAWAVAHEDEQIGGMPKEGASAQYNAFITMLPAARKENKGQPLNQTQIGGLWKQAGVMANPQKGADTLAVAKFWNTVNDQNYRSYLDREKTIGARLGPGEERPEPLDKESWIAQHGQGPYAGNTAVPPPPPPPVQQASGTTFDPKGATDIALPPQGTAPPPAARTPPPPAPPPPAAAGATPPPAAPPNDPSAFAGPRLPATTPRGQYDEARQRQAQANVAEVAEIQRQLAIPATANNSVKRRVLEDRWAAIDPEGAAQAKVGPLIAQLKTERDPAKAQAIRGQLETLYRQIERLGP